LFSAGYHCYHGSWDLEPDWWRKPILHPYELVLQASSPDGVFKELLTIASNGSTKLQAMYIFPYIMWVRMCSTSGFPELNSDRNLAYWLHPALCPFVAVMFM